MKRFIILLAFVSLSGCGVSNIVNRGELINEFSIKHGTHRTDILARFGSPINKKMEEGHLIETYRVPQGETITGKVIKGGGLLFLDLITLGLSEAIATPATDGKRYVTFAVTYDKDEIVRDYRVISQ